MVRFVSCLTHTQPMEDGKSQGTEDEAPQQQATPTKQ
jgi:hypothetical protein